MASLQNSTTNLLPTVLLPNRPTAFYLFGENFFDSSKYHFLRSYQSPLPIHQFLSAHGHSVTAVLSSGNFPLTVDIICLLPALRLVVATSAGLDHVDLTECRRLGISVANAADVYSEDVADSAVGLLIDVLRKVSGGDRYVKQGVWASKGDYPLGSKLTGKRIGIVGLGSIGSAVATRLEAFNCRIAYNSKTKKQAMSYPFYPNVSELAATSDALIICCALTSQTLHMINKQVLLALGREGVIINVGRGAIIDEKEMVRCLVEGEIAGAGLDVFEQEPCVPKELFGLDNVVMSPHRASFTYEAYESLRKLVVANFEAFFSNEPLLTPVDNI